ncbi:MAG: hypothetical protein ABIG20_05400 [archaeon]
MASKTINLIKQPRIIILLLFVILSILSIPTFNDEGVQISYVLPESPFYGQLTEGQVITSLNSHPVQNLEEYAAEVAKIPTDQSLAIEANGKTYREIVQADKTDRNAAYLGIHVTTPATSNINLGLDLQGGARVILNPIPADGVEMTDELFDTTMSVLMTRMNMYGLKNVYIRKVKDVDGNTFMEVEMAGEGSEQVVGIVKSIGKFELRILNETILGGDAIVRQSIGEPTIDSQSGSYEVPFTLTAGAAKDLQQGYAKVAPRNPTTCSQDTDCDESYACSSGIGSGMCLPQIQMYLDDRETFSAPPHQSLHQTWLAGENYKNLRITTGTIEQAQEVYVVLKAGQLPGELKELEVLSQDYVDPKLGEEFLQGAIFAAIAALVAVSLVVSIRYRKLKVLLPIIFMDICEIIIIIGLASMIHWSIDLPAIAGIIMVLGIAVDQQIVITDEVFSGKSAKWSVKHQVKGAYKIVIIAASTTIAAMFSLLLPMFTGLHMLRGFAIVTILGVLIGLFITRPAFAKMAEMLFGEE